MRNLLAEASRVTSSGDRGRATGDAGRCRVETDNRDLVEPSFMRCLYDGGRALGERGPSVWYASPRPSMPLFAPPLSRVRR